MGRLNFDARNFSVKQLEKLAWQVHGSEDWTIPRLRVWNYDLCRFHKSGWLEEFESETGQVETRLVKDSPKPGCLDCALLPKAHQRCGAAWLYFKKHALLADVMGLGKTTTIGLLIALLAETGELAARRDDAGMGRVVIVPRSVALGQWQREIKRMMPHLLVKVAEGSKSQRLETYSEPWQVLLIGPEMLWRDIESIESFDLALLVADDIDALRNPETRTSYTLDRLGARGVRHNAPSTDRYVIVTGTPLQKRLPELHSILDGIGGLAVLGSLDNFTRKHVRYGERVNDKGKSEKIVVGYRRLSEVKEQIAPMVLRRTPEDLKDVTLPSVIPEDVFLDLHPRQRAKYNELRQGVISLLKDGVEKTKWTTAFSKLHYGASICAGLATLGEEDGPGTSMKLDWLVEQLRSGELSEEKVVCFINLTSSVKALQSRLTNSGIGFVTLWGKETNKGARAQATKIFWSDPNCRVLIGTRTIEQSLNLQVSRHLVNFDTILNPARMEQLAGRIRRQGSAFQTVFVHNLLTVNTQEAKYPGLLAREAALSSHIWDEEVELFKKLTPEEMYRLITD